MFVICNTNCRPYLSPAAGRTKHARAAPTNVIEPTIPIYVLEVQ